MATPVREALVKVTLSIDQPVVGLSQLFKDLSVDDSMSNVMAVEHLDGTLVSILVSKTTNKYRLQSDNLAALALLVVELQRRFGATRVTLDSPLPVQETWNRIEHHYATWSALKSEMVFYSRLVVVDITLPTSLLNIGKYEWSDPTVSNNTAPVSQQDSKH